MQCVKRNVVSLLRGDESRLATAWMAPDILEEPKEPEPTEEELALERAFEEAREKGYAEGHQRGLAEGSESGYQTGYREGMEKAEAEGEQQLQQQQQQHQEQMQQQQQHYDELMAGLEPVVHALKNPLGIELEQTTNLAIATLATNIARQVIKSELTVQPDHIVNVVNQLFEELPLTDREVRFYLHPEDRELVESAEKLFTRGFEWRLESDEALSRGGCHVESHNFSVNETVEERLAHSVNKIFGLTPEEIAPEGEPDPAEDSTSVESEVAEAEPEEAVAAADSDADASQSEVSSEATPEEATPELETELEVDADADAVASAEVESEAAMTESVADEQVEEVAVAQADEPTPDPLDGTETRVDPADEEV